MIINNNIRVIGLLKPTLTISLEEGGSLLPNTKYYVVGMMSISPATYTGLGGPLSDVYEITTTSTAKSIHIYQQTFRTIQGFSDNGDGRTLVHCERHCVGKDLYYSDFRNSDIVNIVNGSYQGEYIVDDWVDYDYFIINTPFIDDYITEFYTDTIRYNSYYRYSSTYNGMTYYISTHHPFDENYIHLSQWTRPPYRTYNIENPTIVTSQPTQSNRWVQPVLARMNKGMYKILEDYGNVYIDITGDVTLEDIYNEVQISGFPYNCSWSETGVYSFEQFHLCGAIKTMGGTLNAESVSIIIWGAMYDYYGGSAINFTNCNIILPVSMFSTLYKFTANGSVFYGAASSNGYTGWVFGDNVVIYDIPRPQAIAGNCDIPNLKYLNLDSGEECNYGIIENKEFKTTVSNASLQVSYNQNQFINVKMYYPFYWIMLKDDNYGTQPDIYMCENCYISTTSSNEYHYRFYAYNNVTYNHLKFLNIDTDNEDNIKICEHNISLNLTADFYRRFEIYVQDNNDNIISNAEISIVDDSNNIYQGTTNENGYLYLDVLEQTYSVDGEIPPEYGYNPNRNTFYGNFVLTIKKDGYYDYTENIKNSQDILKYISLKELEPPIYVDSNMNSEINTENIQSKIEEESITGDISIESINSNINENNINTTISNDDITNINISSFNINGDIK